MKSAVTDVPFNLLCPFQRRWLAEPASLAGAEKSRRIGWTWSHALGAVLGRVEGGSNYYHSSTDRSAAVEFIDYCAEWARMVNAVATVRDEVEVIDDEKITSQVMTFANGRKIIAGTSNPKFFRSKGGDVGLDEVDFHGQQRELFTAAHATALFWGYKLRFWSSVNGEGTEMAHLAEAIRRGAVRGAMHRVTILDAVEDGIVERIDMRRRRLSDVPAADARRRQEWLDELRSTCPDQETWDQEYLCIRRAGNSALLGYELLHGCEVANLVLWPTAAESGPRGTALYAGMDVGRRHDLSVLWVVEQVGDVAWTRMLRIEKNATFAAQEQMVNALLANSSVKRLCIDATGLGMDLSERLQRRWGHRVEPITFTPAVKADLALPLLRAFQDRAVRIPAANDVREDLHSVRKVVTAAGNIRFDAERDEGGHADRFWALALAHHAGHTAAPRHAPLMEVPLGW